MNKLLLALFVLSTSAAHADPEKGLVDWMEQNCATHNERAIAKQIASKFGQLSAFKTASGSLTANIGDVAYRPIELPELVREGETTVETFDELGRSVFTTTYSALRIKDSGIDMDPSLINQTTGRAIDLKIDLRPYRTCLDEIVAELK